MKSSPWVPTPRLRLSDQDKARLFVERDGCCWKCNRKLRPGDQWSVEHVIALENGGDNAWSNLDVTCAWCKPGKDAADHSKAAGSRHKRTFHVLPSSERDKRRGFAGWRKFNGEPVWKKV
jgi:5-methylcytosine-specific restriction endonuclease McrA